MNINKFISQLLCNKDIIVNLHKLHFLFLPFSLQSNKRVFHHLTFPPLQPNTKEEKLNIFHPLTFSLPYPNGALGKATLVLYKVTNQRLCLYISLPILHQKKKKSPYFTDLYVVTNERLCLLCEVSTETVLYIVSIGKRSPTHVFYELRTHNFLD